MRFGKIIFLLLVFFGLPALIYHSSFFHVSEVFLPKNQLSFLPTAEQKKIKKTLESYKGQNLLSLSLNQVKKKLYQDGLNVEFILRKNYPSGLTLSFREKDVVLFYLPQAGPMRGIGLWGEVLALGPNLSKDMAVLVGKTSLSSRQKAIQFWSSLSQTGSFSRSTVLEISYDVSTQSLKVKVAFLERVLEVNLGKKLSTKKTERVNAILFYLQQNALSFKNVDARNSFRISVF